MSVTIIHKKGSGVPSAESLEVAEVCVDIVTGILYTKLLNGEVVAISSPDGGGSNVSVSDDMPTDPESGDMWYCTKDDNEGMFVFDNGVWFESTTAALEGPQGPEGPAGGIEEAPEDSLVYGRSDAEWVEVTSGGDADIDLSSYVSTDVDVYNERYVFNGTRQGLRWYRDKPSGRKFDIIIGQNNTYPSVGMESAFFIGGSRPDDKGFEFSINEFGTVELQGMRLYGKEGANISGFDTIQATDFLDADGDSIMGGGGGGLDPAVWTDQLANDLAIMASDYVSTNFPIHPLIEWTGGFLQLGAWRIGVGPLGFQMIYFDTPEGVVFTDSGVIRATGEVRAESDDVIDVVSKSTRANKFTLGDFIISNVGERLCFYYQNNLKAVVDENGHLNMIGQAIANYGSVVKSVDIKSADYSFGDWFMSADGDKLSFGTDAGVMATVIGEGSFAGTGTVKEDEELV